MQQCWKLATLEKFVCLNTHSLALQNTCTSTSPTHVAVLRTVSFSPPVTLLLFSLALEWLYCPLLLLKHCLQIAQVLPYQLKRKQWDIKKRACNAGIRWIARQWISSTTRSTCTCKYVRTQTSGYRPSCPGWCCTHFYCFIMPTINLLAVNLLCFDKTLPVNFLHSTCS